MRSGVIDVFMLQLVLAPCFTSERKLGANVGGGSKLSVNCVQNDIFQISCQFIKKLFTYPDIVDPHQIIFSLCGYRSSVDLSAATNQRLPGSNPKQSIVQRQIHLQKNEVVYLVSVCDICKIKREK